MKEYLADKSHLSDKELISIIDELPLWSAPFGLSLLNKIKMGKGLNVLDIGCGTGFPLVEIAQRLGDSCRVFGIDPWQEAIERGELKISKYQLRNVEIKKGLAEKLPFGDSYFNIIVSNNGINNVEDIKQTFSECSRVSRKGAQFLFTMNTDGSMLEFYNVLKSEFEKDNNTDSIDRLKKHIYEKRKPVSEIKALLAENNFKLDELSEQEFYLRFTDGTAMLKHSFIKYWFMSSWEKLIEPGDVPTMFERVEQKLNEYAIENGELKLTIPFAVFNCTKI